MLAKNTILLNSINPVNLIRFFMRIPNRSVSMKLKQYFIAFAGTLFFAFFIFLLAYFFCSITVQ